MRRLSPTRDLSRQNLRSASIARLLLQVWLMTPRVAHVSLLLFSALTVWAGPEQLPRHIAPHKDSKEMPPIVLTAEEEKQRAYMVEISRQIGVTCTYCHDVKNFKNSSMKEWKVSKRHIDFVKSVNQDPKKLLGPKMDCYMCHRGEAKPEFREPLELVD